jgi:hypothetical protein
MSSMKNVFPVLGLILTLTAGCATSRPDAKRVSIYLVTVDTRNTRPWFEALEQFKTAGCELSKQDLSLRGPGWSNDHETENRALYAGANRVVVIQLASFPGAQVSDPESGVTHNNYYYRCPDSFQASLKLHPESR